MIDAFARDVLGLDLSKAQSVLLRAIYGERLGLLGKRLFREASGLDSYPRKPYPITSVVCGRRAGKTSRIAVPMTLFEAYEVCRGVPANERWTVLILAPTEAQAKTTFDIVLDTVRTNERLNSMVERVLDSSNTNEIQLRNRMVIKTAAANLRYVRNLTIACCICEESAFFQGDEDSERALRQVLEAVSPAMATVPNSKLLRMSSPWTQSGMAYEDVQNRRETPHKLVWQLPSQKMNPTIPDSEIELYEKEYGRAACRREYYAEFSSETNGFLTAEDIDAAAVPDVEGIEPESADDVVVGAIDASQFSDHFAAAQTSCTEDGFVTLNFATAQEPLNGKVPILSTMNEVGRIFKENGVQAVFSDRVSSTTIQEILAQFGIPYTRVVTMGDGAVEMFSRVAALFRAGRVRIPGGNRTLVSQLKRLKMILQPGGGVRVEAKTGHDDQAIAACIAIFQADQHKFSKSWAEVIRL